MLSSRTSRGRAWCWLALLLSVSVLATWGQEPPAAPAPPAAEPAAPAAVEAPAPQAESASEEPETLLKMILASGTMGVAFMVVLGAFSVVAAALSLERSVRLTRRQVVPAEAATALHDLAGQRDVRSADRYRDVCRRFPSPFSRIVEGALLRVGRPLPEIEKAMEDGAAKEFAALKGTVRPLSVIASVAPLVGLLGTVVGMIDAFRVASQAGLGKAELLAEGIYLALLTTAAGLIIAIPCVILAAYLNHRIDRFMWESDAQLMPLLPALASLGAASPTASESPALQKPGRR